MAATREVITIQCGHYSNFIGSHWWNIQESGVWSTLLSKEQRNEINYNVTFREGVTHTRKETYTPRLISIDCTGSLNSLKVDGTLYDNTNYSSDVCGRMWEGSVESFASPANQKNDFLKDLDELDKGLLQESDINSKQYSFESTVKVWSDYARTHFHPRTILTVPGYHHNDNRFNTWMAGQELWKTNREFKENFEDRIHHYTEECDYLQGYQLLYDLYPGGFSSLTSCIIQYLHDEFNTKPLITIPVMNMISDMATQDIIYYTFNSALSLSESWENSSLIVPLSVATSLWRTPSQPLLHPSINYDASLPYHSSSILAAAIETFTSIYRSAYHTMSNVTGLLSNRGRKLCSLSFDIPLELNESKLTNSTVSLISSLISMTPYCLSSCDELWSQSVCIRGNRTLPHPDMLTHHIYKTHPSTDSQISVYQTPLITDVSFPSILNPPSSVVSSCVSLQSHSGISSLLTALHDHTQGYNPCTVPLYVDTVLDIDSYRELLSTLLELRDCYITGYIDDNYSTDDD